ncbi:hypothetical protein BN440_3984 [Erwinia amylovora MR1]|nr:hypothetical protein BN440_3984 [Erwinia amylovora MR1]
MPPFVQDNRASLNKFIIGFGLLLIIVFNGIILIL